MAIYQKIRKGQAVSAYGMMSFVLSLDNWVPLAASSVTGPG